MGANTDVVRSAFQAFSNRDMDALAGVMASDVTWHIPGSNQLSGDYTSLDEVMSGFFGRMGQLADGPMSTDVARVLEDGDHAIAEVTVTGSVDGKPLTNRAAMSYRIEDGKVKEVTIYTRDQEHLNEVWGNA